MRFTPGAPGQAPVVEFDIRKPEAAIAMFAVATWPADPKRQRSWLAVHEAAVIEMLKKPPDHLRAADLARYQLEALQTGRDPEELAEEGRATLSARAYQRLEAVGGYTTVIDSPAMEALVEEVVQAAGAGPGLAGKILLTLACMQEHHADLRPSLNRAWAVVEASMQRRKDGKVAGANERALKDAWRDHKATAPLWAALQFHLLVVSAVPGPAVAPGAAFLDPQHRYLVLAAAAWFREFAMSFKANRALKPLISPTEMLDLRVEVDAAKPHLLRLPPGSLEVARNYHAKNTKQGY
jgi:hypothetical protein